MKLTFCASQVTTDAGLLAYRELDEALGRALLSWIKRPFSFQIKKILEEHNRSLLEKLPIQQRPGKTTFRFWQEGPGYDRNLDNRKSIDAAIKYIHLNPVRRGLAEKTTDYLWSSSRFFEVDDYETDSALPRIDGINRDLIE